MCNVLRQAFRGNQVTCLKILPQQIQEIVDLVGQHQEKAPEFLDLLNIIVKVAASNITLAFPIIFLLHVALSTPLPAFQISLARVFPSCFRSSFLPFSLVFISILNTFLSMCSSSHAHTSLEPEERLYFVESF